MSSRYALIIGAMKCGTTSVFRHLSTHPQIAPARIKEPHFFSNDRVWNQGLPWYEGLWEGAPPDAWRLEASTGYTKLPLRAGVPQRIQSTGIEARFIYLMRNPLARIESHRRHALLRAKTGEAAADEFLFSHLVAVSKYAMQLDAYRERFPREHFLLLSFEQLMADPDLTLKRIAAFLGVDSSFSFPAANTPFNKSARDGTAYKLLTRIPGASTLAQKLPLSLRQAVRNRLSNRADDLPPLSEEKRDWALAELRPDLERLRTEYGFDTSVWALPHQTQVTSSK